MLRTITAFLCINLPEIQSRTFFKNKKKRNRCALHQFLYRMRFSKYAQSQVFCGLAQHDIDHCHGWEHLLDVLYRTVEQEIGAHYLRHEVCAYVHWRP